MHGEVPQSQVAFETPSIIVHRVPRSRPNNPSEVMCCDLAISLMGGIYLHSFIPKCSMYGIFSYICPNSEPNVGKYTILRAHGICNEITTIIPINSHQSLVQM